MRSVNTLNGGEILAEPIMDDNNILIPKGTVLKVDYLPLIQSLGIDCFMVEDPYEDFEEPHFIVDQNKLYSYVEKVRNIIGKHVHSQNDELRELQVVANEIVKDVDALSDDAAIDINEHSADLYEHSVMVALLSVLLAKKSKLKKAVRYEVALGALLHDIGLRYITSAYENRDMDALDPIETFEYRKHTILGYCALEKVAWVPDRSRKMVLSHHERMDRSGFPMKQSSDDLAIRIVQLCDAFDGRIAGVEHKRTPVRKTMDYLFANAGRKYDENLVNLLMKLVAHYPVGTTLDSASNKKTIVVSQTTDPENPVVMELDQITEIQGKKRKGSGDSEGFLHAFL